jgi:hypothetical protein
MPEREFIPFSPRRLERPTDVATHDLDEDTPASSAETTQRVADAISDNNSDLSVPPFREEDESMRASQPDVSGMASAEDDPSQVPATKVDVSTVYRCDHACEIRNEAVRLASIACGRALRHAVVLHPKVIAAFVDDALRSAGTRQVERIRVHSDVAQHVDPRCGPVQIAEELSPGDVFIDLNNGSVGATLETRAELLVAAAAES